MFNLKSQASMFKSEKNIKSYVKKTMNLFKQKQWYMNIKNREYSIEIENIKCVKIVD